ncbi:16S rRNA (guanine(527)-N(7))-methyltransferase RsmG [Borrelia hermsii]|uniref:Ribosomal RNA small subunit methyltransferase G n=3 Tax=Borrelia hermsii TaxID=140 RepID=RSMG_BORHD|nr:16S rRNA (guanine(527)-N(7))-methyltransferase RsmG [Borrelia hermsii]B2RZN8.1 RecName: Full=Ribosomal RNA small subunit methyltransferase G; AltName: Full=16S rRNA 7-methylguanosine methyltransferase; Short=16S rRNA m7G methyltransferase [Borrelia hermsii DAH]AAX16694.1 methyltransferase GidB [Borrelia hermsii DAH]AMR75648.1 16S rRNA (guanine(527)-N(7))-methyltransferase [Borrelia hermsii]ANA42993.1 16S rRNA (guanine(527)-N(7))-methyltransferase RsmG [Borrelia hermsii HS1]UPA07522.1 16S rR
MINYFELSLKNLGVSFTSESIDKLKFYIKRVLLFGSRFNLVSKNDLRFDAVLLHALDSVVGFPIIKDNNPHQVLDVGSGAGFPGIILAIFDNSRKYVLLERSNKKVTFLRMMSLELGLDNVKVLERDVADEKDKYEFITIRAFRDIREYASILRLILKNGGLIMAYKGRFDKIKFEISHIESLFSKIEIKESAISDAKERNFLLLYK